MKSIKALYLTITMLLSLLSRCSNAQDSPTASQSVEKKILIVYLSRTNNTKAIAEIIHKNVGGILVQLELVNPYPKDYRAIVDQVAKENETRLFTAAENKDRQHGKVRCGISGLSYLGNATAAAAEKLSEAI